MKKQVLQLLSLSLFFCCVLTGCACEHNTWKDATCTTPQTCAACGVVYGKAQGHSIGNWEVTKEASCTENGEKTAACTVCQEIFVEELEKLDHQIGDWRITKEASLEEDGEQVRECTVCGKVLETGIVKLSSDERNKAYKAACKSYTYDEIARYPDKYKGERARFEGKVIQVIEGSLASLRTYTLRVDITKTSWGYDDTVYVTYVDTANNGRILEGDIITMYGTLEGTKTYKTVLGSQLTIPSFSASIIE